MPRYKVYGNVVGRKYLGEFDAPNKYRAVEVALIRTDLVLINECPHLKEQGITLADIYDGQAVLVDEHPAEDSEA